MFKTLFDFLRGKNAEAKTKSWNALFATLFMEAGLIYGVWLRLLFFRSFPDPLAQPDSLNYLTGAFGLLERGQFSLSPQRTPVFPLLAWISLALFKTFAAINVIHCALTLLCALTVAGVVKAFGGSWRWPAAFAVSFLVINPHLLYWEHFIMTEGSFQAFFAIAVCAVALVILKPTPIRAGVAGTLVAIAVLTRPQAIFLPMLMLLAVIWVGRRLGRRKFIALIGAAVAGPIILLGGWSARNAAVHGFFGLTNIGPLVYFGVSARWIDLESPTLAEDKALIADRIRRYRSMPDSVGWVQYSEDGPGYLIDQKYKSDPNRRDAVYSALAREAILSHPLAFIDRGLRTSYLTVTGVARASGLDYEANVEGWDQNWEALAKSFPVNQYRAALNRKRFPETEREAIFDQDLLPILIYQTPFLRLSLLLTLISLVSLPLLSGRRRIATALSAVSVVLLILSAGFLSDNDDRYMSAIHGSSVLASALAITGLVDRWRSRAPSAAQLTNERNQGEV